MSTPHAPTLPERIAAASRRPATLGQTPPGTVSLAMGEPDAETPPAVVDAAVDALRRGRTHYAPSSGLDALRGALAEHVQTTTGRATTSREVVLGHGASGVLAAAALALVGPGDRVLVPEPTYSLYADHLAMAGAETVWVPNLPGHTLDLDRLGDLADSARMIVLCNPSNPTGAVLGARELARLAQIVARRRHLLLLVDEAYGEIVFGDERLASALELTEVQDRTVVVRTFSKTYAMTGWRLGYAVAPEPLAARIDLVHRTFNGALNTFVQDAALEAIALPDDVLRTARDEYRRRRDLVVDELSRLEGVSVSVPAGAFYAFPRIDCGLDSEQLVEAFARGGVLVRAGSEYGPSGEGHVRISFAADDLTLREGLRRFAAVVVDLVGAAAAGSRVEEAAR